MDVIDIQEWKKKREGDERIKLVLKPPPNKHSVLLDVVKRNRATDDFDKRVMMSAIHDLVKAIETIEVMSEMYAIDEGIDESLTYHPYNQISNICKAVLGEK
jgi:hypothetical protein